MKDAKLLLPCAACLLASSLVAQQRDISQLPYVPQHVTVPTDRPYTVAPNTVFVAGNDVLIPLFTKLDARWEELEPQVKFKKIMMGSTLSVEGLVEVGLRPHRSRQPASGDRPVRPTLRL
jgi:phosphate transport system substrate-binding protein